MRPMHPAVIAAAIAVTYHPVLRAQQGPELQRRVLAEAVSSYSDTGEFFIVASTVSPFKPLDYYRTRAAADSAAAGAGATYRVNGPYRGPSRRDPWEVLSITVRVRTADGEEELHFDPRRVDAVFLSMSAVRKFMVPYYKQIYGPQVSGKVEALILSPRVPRPPCHAMSVPCSTDSLFTMPVEKPTHH